MGIVDQAVWALCSVGIHHNLLPLVEVFLRIVTRSNSISANFGKRSPNASRWSHVQMTAWVTTSFIYLFIDFVCHSGLAICHMYSTIGILKVCRKKPCDDEVAKLRE